MDRADRIAVVVRPLPPYFEWARRVSDIALADPARFERRTRVYLLPDYLGDDPAGLRDRLWARVFRHELEEWEPDRGYWPTLSRERFDDWFEVEIQADVFDLTAELAPR